MNIRKADKSDLAKCLELLKENDFKYCTGEFPSETWISEFFNEHFYVIEIDDIVVGCYLATNIFSDGIYCWYMVVDKLHRNTNIASYLLSSMEKMHKDAGRTWIYFISPFVNYAFYMKRGYIPHHSTCKEFYKDI